MLPSKPRAPARGFVLTGLGAKPVVAVCLARCISDNAATASFCWARQAGASDRCSACGRANRGDAVSHCSCGRWLRP